MLLSFCLHHAEDIKIIVAHNHPMVASIIITVKVTRITDTIF